ncbi:GNAT family N-acetyltransferase [Aestuariimicrobium ganziense]|uniref:GNAT family N-acetyltransferase n=1 Tax=Aestuariimicrobium ganziense TaxID=2773677 RepID=UPI001943F35D|nr:GNAT family N-acetyltransferase [Aestuariimicrobium ganziense]
MLHVRPVVPNDVLLWAEVEPDRWRLGGNRRSFVAELDGQLVGHCRGIDNACHPGSRTLVLEVRTEWRNRGVGTALLKAQVEASTLPLRAKITGAMPEAWALARTFGAVVEQACPPWRRVVEPPSSGLGRPAP